MRYATHLTAMRDGMVLAEGAPGEGITPDVVEKTFGLRCRVIDDPEAGTPLVIPARPRG